MNSFLNFRTFSFRNLTLSTLSFRASLVFFCGLITGVSFAIEEPKYTIIEKSGDFELRRYEAMIIAETHVDGSMGKASNKGFRNIAAYIFGDNISKVTNEKEKIQMTAPVGIIPVIPIKADQPSMSTLGSDTNYENNKQWHVSFVMPRSYSLDSLPIPKDKNVRLKKIPEQRIAAIRFSGLVNEKDVSEKTSALKAWLATKNISSEGVAQLARYNPPWTLPFLRRNEILIPY